MLSFSPSFNWVIGRVHKVHLTVLTVSPAFTLIETVETVDKAPRYLHSPS
jgi:site-specific recombinase